MVINKVLNSAFACSHINFAILAASAHTMTREDVFDSLGEQLPRCSKTIIQHASQLRETHKSVYSCTEQGPDTDQLRANSRHLNSNHSFIN